MQHLRITCSQPHCGRKTVLLVLCTLIGWMCPTLASSSAFAAPSPRWHLDTFLEGGAFILDSLDEGGSAGSVGKGIGIVGMVHASSVLAIGSGLRYLAFGGSGGSYDRLSLPLLAQVGVPLSHRGHTLVFGIGCNASHIWEEDDTYGAKSSWAPQFEGLVGYAGPPNSIGLAFLAQTGTEVLSSESAMLSAVEVWFIRLGMSYR